MDSLQLLQASSLNSRRKVSYSSSPGPTIPPGIAHSLVFFLLTHISFIKLFITMEE